LSYRKSEGIMPAGAKSSPRSTPKYSTKLYDACAARLTGGAAQVTETQACELQLACTLGLTRPVWGWGWG
jgi:hypothetical protein